MLPTCQRVLSGMLPNLLAAAPSSLEEEEIIEFLSLSRNQRVVNRSSAVQTEDMEFQGRVALTHGHSWAERKCENLLLVAHPDDDLIFAGETILCSALYDDSVNASSCWKIVVASDGGRRGWAVDWHRVQSAANFATLAGAEFEVWKGFEAEYMERLLVERRWKVVFTHSSWGEYGNGYHKYISNAVRNFRGNFDLWFFNPRPDRPIPPSPLKLYAIPLYSSEAPALESLWFWSEFPVRAALYREEMDPSSFEMPLFPQFMCGWPRGLAHFWIHNESFSTGKFNNTVYIHLRWADHAPDALHRALPTVALVVVLLGVLAFLSSELIVRKEPAKADRGEGEKVPLVASRLEKI